MGHANVRLGKRASSSAVNGRRNISDSSPFHAGLTRATLTCRLSPCLSIATCPGPSPSHVASRAVQEPRGPEDPLAGDYKCPGEAKGPSAGVQAREISREPLVNADALSEREHLVCRECGASLVW